MLKKAERDNKSLCMVEELWTMKSPCMEAEYAIDERTTLSLYDCMVPKLKEHRRFRIQKDSPFSLADFKMQLKIKEYENSMEVR